VFDDYGDAYALIGVGEPGSGGGIGEETDPVASAALTVHAADTTAVHGIADTAALVLTSDARLTNARTPTAHKTTHEPGGSDAMTVDAAAGTGSLRTLGTGATSAAAGNRGLPTGGEDGQVLAKQSGTDYDVAWESVSGGGVAAVLPLVRVERSATVTPTAGAYYGPVAFDVEESDPSGFWNGTRFKPTAAGWYDISVQLSVTTLSGTAPEINGYLAKNVTGAFPATGTTEAYDKTNVYPASGETSANLNFGGPVYFNGTTDYVEVFVWFTNGVISNGNGTHFAAEPAGAPGALALDTWHLVGAAGEPAFAAGVSNAGGAEAPLAFRKDAFGRVAVRGAVVVPSTTNSQIFTLPAGYRPIANQRFSCVDYNTGAFIDVYALATGAVHKIGTSTAVDAGGIEFDTDTVSALAVGPVIPGAWTALTLLSSWVSYGVGYEPRYRKDSMGMVHLTGLIKHAGGQSANTSSTFSSVAAGLRPGGPQASSPIMSYSGTAQIIGAVYVTSAGNLNVWTPTALTASGYHDLSAMRWLAEA
jgi:hypothetical protein